MAYDYRISALIDCVSRSRGEGFAREKKFGFCPSGVDDNVVMYDDNVYHIDIGGETPLVVPILLLLKNMMTTMLVYSASKWWTGEDNETLAEEEKQLFAVRTKRTDTNTTTPT